MKRKKLTGITLLAASALVSTAFGGALLGDGVKASAAAETFALSDVFAVSSAEIKKTEDKVTAFAMSDEGSVTLKRDLAFKWYEAGNKKNLTLKFAFEDLAFETVTFAVDSTSAWATEDDKATNKIVFKKTSVKVNDGAETAFTFEAKKEYTLTLTETENGGEFTVKLGETEIGAFENIGANWSEYEYGKMNPLKITADLGATPAADAKSTVLLYEINGQSFTNISDDFKVTDTAAPVLVVNEAVDGFLLGTAFSLDYAVVDVLKDSNLTTTLEYYQYNPTDETQTYKTLSTSTYFMDTTYKKGEETTTVFEQNNEEYVAIKVTLADGTFNGAEGNEAKAVYDLAWYANDGRVKTFDGSDIKYLILDRNEKGPEYKLTDAKYAEKKAAFEERLQKAASEVYAGSNSKIEFPSFEWLIGDNNGYRNLKFTISYRAPGSTNASTSSSLSYNNLKLSVSKEGKYEFKIFANDKAGNTTKFTVDGELVDVTSSNIWDIEEIPSFTFSIENKGLKVDDGKTSSERKETEVRDETFTLEDMTVVGATNLQESYKLYKVDVQKFNNNKPEGASNILSNYLTDITYETIASAVATKGLDKVENKEYHKFYLEVYASLIGEKVNATAEEVLATGCFTEIGVAGDRVNNATDEFETYAWNPTAQSFKTVEEGEYLIVADYWEKEIPSQRAMAYKLIPVESESATIKGETDWLKNNVVSGVLFSIAGVMLILIIILLLIKPSDETLEDVDEKVAKKAKTKKN